MFATGPASSAPSGAEELAKLAALRSGLTEVRPAPGSATMLEQLRALRELTSVIAATEATVTAAFTAGRRAEQQAAGTPARRVGAGLGRELGLARRESPNRSTRYAGFAGVLTRELPHTLAALQAGQTSEWRAMLVARETGWLSAEHRACVDADLGPRLGSLGDRDVEAEAARLAYTLDPHGKLRAIERAAGGRHVSLRPAPEGLCRLNATLPLAQGVAAYAALGKAADTARAAGDQRGRGQVMADTLVERITGQASAPAVPVRVDLVMTDQALFRAGARAEEPATVSGHGPVPAPFARDLIRAAANTGAGVSIRRLFTDPAGRLVTMETDARTFTPAMAEFIRLRDQWCTTVFCGAPIRHIDHLLPYAQGGPTSLTNAEGKCEACNYASQAPGWQNLTTPDGRTQSLTPTGHDANTFTPLAAPTFPTPAPPSAPSAVGAGAVGAPASPPPAPKPPAHRAGAGNHRRPRRLRRPATMKQRPNRARPGPPPAGARHVDVAYPPEGISCYYP